MDRVQEVLTDLTEPFAARHPEAAISTVTTHHRHAQGTAPARVSPRLRRSLTTMSTILFECEYQGLRYAGLGKAAAA